MYRKLKNMCKHISEQHSLDFFLGAGVIIRYTSLTGPLVQALWSSSGLRNCRGLLNCIWFRILDSYSDAQRNLLRREGLDSRGAHGGPSKFTNMKSISNIPIFDNKRFSNQSAVYMYSDMWTWVAATIAVRLFFPLLSSFRFCLPC